MNWLPFISQILDSIAWPAVTLICVLILRKPLKNLLPTLRRAKYKDFDLQFGERLEELENKADKANLPEKLEVPIWKYEAPENWTLGDYLEKLAIVSPRVAIIEAWRHVEITLRDTALRNNIEISKNTRVIAKRLIETEKLPKNVFNLLEDLRALRNRAVHGRDFDIKPEQAIEFSRLAERVIATIISNLPKELQSPP